MAIYVFIHYRDPSQAAEISFEISMYVCKHFMSTLPDMIFLLFQNQIQIDLLVSVNGI